MGRIEKFSQVKCCFLLPSPMIRRCVERDPFRMAMGPSPLIAKERVRGSGRGEIGIRRGFGDGSAGRPPNGASFPSSAKRAVGFGRESRAQVSRKSEADPSLLGRAWRRGRFPRGFPPRRGRKGPSKRPVAAARWEGARRGFPGGRADDAGKNALLSQGVRGFYSPSGAAFSCSSFFLFTSNTAS